MLVTSKDRQPERGNLKMSRILVPAQLQPRPVPAMHMWSTGRIACMPEVQQGILRESELSCLGDSTQWTAKGALHHVRSIDISLVQNLFEWCLYAQGRLCKLQSEQHMRAEGRYSTEAGIQALWAVGW